MRTIRFIRDVEATLSAAGLSFDDFYVITFWDDEVKLQGNYTSQKARRVQRLDPKSKISEQGYVEAVINVVVYAKGPNDEAAEMIPVKITLT